MLQDSEGPSPMQTVGKETRNTKEKANKHMVQDDKGYTMTVMFCFWATSKKPSTTRLPSCLKPLVEIDKFRSKQLGVRDIKSSMAPPPGPYSGTSTLALVARVSAFSFGLVYGSIKLKYLQAKAKSHQKAAAKAHH
ncbi:hypothetical protein ACET3Z_021064 [Daucus carota]